MAGFHRRLPFFLRIRQIHQPTSPATARIAMANPAWSGDDVAEEFDNLGTKANHQQREQQKRSKRPRKMAVRKRRKLISATPADNTNNL